jgi:hypothetical protein
MNKLRIIGWCLFIVGGLWSMMYILAHPSQKTPELRAFYLYPGLGIAATGMFTTLLNGVIRSTRAFRQSADDYHPRRHRSEPDEESDSSAAAE